jgi:hypothetical protein
LFALEHDCEDSFFSFSCRSLSWHSK